MEGVQTTLNVTMQAIQYLSQAYSFVYVQLKKNDITLPAPDRVVSVSASMISYILAHSPRFIQSLQALIAQLPIESNIASTGVLLVVLYIMYRCLLATFRWTYGIVYGFIKFSLFMGLAASVIYIIQEYLVGAALFPGSSTHHEGGTRST